MTTPRDSARDLRFLVVLVLLKWIASSALLKLGFTHISDDDYARIVIGQAFAHRPALDPSGTSWLPFPFWLEGGVFMIAGRSLSVATGLSMVQGSVGWGALFLAMRRAHLGVWPAWVCTAVAMCLPWNAWLGATIVPEGYVGPLLAAAIILATRPNAFAAIALLICTLSRYESWPVAGAVAAHWFFLSARVRNARWMTLAFAAMAGMAIWMAWNRYAHGDALHFFLRVSRYRQGLHLPAKEVGERVALYPMAVLAVLGPFSWAAVGSVAAIALPSLRALWRVPLALCAVQLAALVLGELKDGAPTHHPERAVLAIAIVLLAAGTSGWVTLFTIAKRRSAREMLFIGSGTALSIFGLAWIARTSFEFPGKSASESRQPQLARGALLSSSARYRVTPCAYEHFALIAAFGRPEQIEIREPNARTEPNAQCPSVKILD